MSILTEPPPASPPALPQKIYKVGTLQYTKAGLIWVFIWILWGDFCFTLMEQVVPSIVPLRLKELNAPDWLLPIILVSIPSTLNFILNPIISTASDRHRGRFGRRVPFLLFSTPFITASLVLMAFSTEVGVWLHRVIGPLTGWKLAATAILAVSICMIVFNFLNLFITTVFYYFFNDVVPSPFMARFFALFRIVGSVAGMLYNYFIYQHALTHMRAIFLGAAAVYFLGFSAMCIFIKEGKYPPPDALGFTLLDRIKTYVMECLSHPLYRYLFAHNMCWNVASACGLFVVFLNLSLGMNLAQLGTLAAGVGLVQLILSYPAAMLADRFHPLRILVWIKVGMVIIAPLNLVFLFVPMNPHQAYLTLIAISIIELPLGLLYDTVLQPMQMRILPKSRYGQFCSFNAIVQAGCRIGAAIAAGLFMSWMRSAFPDALWGKDFCYRFIPVWKVPFLCVALIFLVLLYREWKRLGGEKNYRVPGFTHDLEPLTPTNAVEPPNPEILPS